ncbi:tetratricopeptide repeat protein [Streptomyces sp. NPDC091682]|uniref:tetratricopeptide repeat protein n=1 Tax=Streptomyces sp. NPDC091682 TaxID=3366005 RepID=UPI0037F8D507
MSSNPVVARAGALQAADRYEESKAVLAPHLAEEPDDEWAWQMLAVAHEKLGEYELAERAATEMLRISPGHVGALIRLSGVLLRLGRRSEAREAAEEAVRRGPDAWSSHFALSEVLVAYATASAADHERAYEAACEAVRLAPHEPDAHQAVCFTAVRTQRQDVAKQALVEWLRLDPSNETAQAMYTDATANSPDVTAAKAAEMYSAGLAGAPQSPMLRNGLDHATYRLLRGTRWLALACLAAAGAMIDLFVTAKDPVLRELPVPLGNRLWVLMVMAAIWGFGALLRYHRMRTGVQLNIRSLVRRGRWARIVLGQAVVAMLCALLISQIPWTDRSVPMVLFWAGLVAALATMAYDRRKTG